MTIQYGGLAAAPVPLRALVAGRFAPRIRDGVKVVVAGGFASGKTTFVATVSDVDTVGCDAAITTTPSVDEWLPAKAVTTPGLDFGRVRLDRGAQRGRFVYLFGAPGLPRFWSIWPSLVDGALGAVVLVDTRRLERCFAAVDHCEQDGLPYLVCVNGFDGAPTYSEAVLRDALCIDDGVPLISCDARHRKAATAAVTALVEHALAARTAPPERPLWMKPSPQPLRRKP